MLSEDYNSLYIKYTSFIDAKKAQLDKLDKSISDSLTLETEYEEAIKLAEYCMKEQSELKVYVEEVVQSIFAVVFDEDKYSEWKFLFQMTTKTDKVTFAGLRPVFDTPRGIVDVKDGEGEGLCDLVSFALRLSFLMLLPELSRVLILDEVLKHLSRARQQKLLDLLEQLHDTIPVQIVLTTHQDVDAPLTYTVRQVEDVSIVTKEEVGR